MTDSVLDAALAAEAMFGATSLSPRTGQVLRGLADLHPTTLAIMHGAAFQGDGAGALHEMADAYEELAAVALAGE